MPFGFTRAPIKATAFSVSNQSEALRALADLSRRSVSKPLVIEAAKLITRKCEPRDEACELEALFAAVRHESWGGGDPDVAGFIHGFRYVHDPVLFDSFTAPDRLIEQGIIANRAGGAPGGDCDDLSALLAALAGAIGFTTALRAWGPPGEDFQHVYALAGMPKNNPRELVAMDATVRHAYVGWEPPPGRVLNAFVARVPR